MGAGKAHKESTGSGAGGGKPLWRRVLKWTLIVGAVVFVLCVVVGFIVYKSVDIPSANAAFKTQTTKVYYSDGKHMIGTFETQNRTSVDLDEIPKHMQSAAIAAEDRTFYSNRGIDLKGIIRAARNNATTDTTQGASTITQQYVKVLYLTQERTWTRKIKEAVLSLKIHNQMSKHEILDGYLNTIYFGQGAYGVQTAAQTYFDHDVQKLTLRESAFLAAVVNNPSLYDPYDHEFRDRLMGRYRYVLQGMAKLDDISQQRADKAGKKLPKFKKQSHKNTLGGPRGFLLRLTELRLHKQGFTDAQINGGGLKVVTTFDYEKQKDAVDAVQSQAPDLKGLHVALSSVDTETGALRAMYGGPDYVKNQYNWALAGSQPGSAFKPFALAAALNNGFSLNTSLQGDSPIYVGGGDSIQNEQNYSYGTVSLLEATEKSINTAYVDLTMQMEDGPEKIRRAAREAGIPSSVTKGIDPVTAITLGYAVVPNVDMANAYATFANHGEEHDWYVIQKVRDPNGNKLYSHKTKTRKAFSKDVAADVTYALQQVVNAGTGTNAQTVCPTAGKTGTATFQKPGESESYVSSSWWVGYTPKLSTSVMYVRGKNGHGNLEGYLVPFFGASYPASTFRTYMDDAVDPSSCGDFPEPAWMTAEQGDTYVPPSTTATEEESETEETEKTKETKKTKETEKTKETKEPPKTTEPPPTKTTQPPPTKTTQPPPTKTTQPPPTKTTQPPPTKTTEPPGDGGGNGGGGNGGGGNDDKPKNRDGTTQGDRDR